MYSTSYVRIDGSLGTIPTFSVAITDVNQKTSVSVQVCDWNRLRSNKLIGQVLLPMLPPSLIQANGWYTITDPKTGQNAKGKDGKDTEVRTCTWDGTGLVLLANSSS